MGFAYMIREVETNYIDGWYMNADIAEEALTELRSRFPWLHYECSCILKKHHAKLDYIPDSLMLNRHYDDPRRAEPEKARIIQLKE